MIEIQEITTGTIAPIVHMNGTGKNTLGREVCEAHKKVTEAIEAVRNITVHSRDFYVLGENWEEVWQKFVDQSVNRIDLLEKVQDELMIYRRKISKQ